jgi:hypothetical protein
MPRSVYKRWPSRVFPTCFRLSYRFGKMEVYVVTLSVEAVRYT